MKRKSVYPFNPIHIDDDIVECKKKRKRKNTSLSQSGLKDSTVIDSDGVETFRGRSVIREE